jgi:DNA-binding transcriptional LysR family regulator
MSPDLRLIRYFVAVAETGNITRAAEQLHISQPSLSAAIKQLEGQLGVELLARRGRRVTITPPGELLLRRGRELLAQADAVVEDVRAHAAASPSRLRVGMTPTARYGVGPRLLAACAAHAPAVMLYTSEDTTGALLRDVAASRLDLAVTFCAPQPPPPGVTLIPLVAEPAVVHLPDSHPLAARAELTLADLADETILVASSHDSGGFTERVLAAFAAAGLTPRTRPDPYPDLGLQAVRERLGVVIYARGAYPDPLPGSAFVPLVPPVPLPFHLATSNRAAGAATRAVADAARTLSEPDASAGDAAGKR